MVLEPPSSAQSEEITNAILSGFIYGTAMVGYYTANIIIIIIIIFFRN